MIRQSIVLMAVFFVFGLLVSCSTVATKPNPVDSQPKTAANPPAKQTNPKEAEEVTPPETVQSEELRIVKGVMLLTVGNAKGHYLLSCNIGQDSCRTLTPGKDYFLFTKSTRWKFPGAYDYVTLEWLQSWSGSYNHKENVALVPNEGERTSIGIYWLHSWEKNK